MSAWSPVPDAAEPITSPLADSIFRSSVVASSSAVGASSMMVIENDAEPLSTSLSFTVTVKVSLVEFSSRLGFVGALVSV